jgi:hypothetical protein
MKVIRFVRSAGGVLAVGALFFAAAGPVHGSDLPVTDSRWLPWLGCWQPVDQVGDHLLCIRPLADDAGVEMVTYSEGRIVSQETVRADGDQRSLRREGCNGWESGSFSEDTRRVYLRSEFACEGDVRRTSSGLISMMSPRTWMDVQVVGVGGRNGVRVARYELAAPDRVAAAGIEPIGEDRAMAINAARTAASGSIGIEDIIDASAHAAPEAVEAWVVERGDRVRLDADKLVQMANAGVPESVIDLVIAVSYPNRFAVDLDSREGELLAPEGRTGDPDVYAYPGYVDPFYWDPFRYGGYGWYSPWGYRGGGRGYYYPPIVVVPSPGEGEADPPGRVVKGRGYKRGGSRTVSEPAAGESYRAPPSASSRPDAGSVKPGSSTGSSSTGKAGSSGSSEPRKAKPRGGTSGTN